MTIFFK